jgi:uncharacterized protein involved in type VI secretion and phage assembly
MWLGNAEHVARQRRSTRRARRRAPADSAAPRQTAGREVPVLPALASAVNRRQVVVGTERATSRMEDSRTAARLPFRH